LGKRDSKDMILRVFSRNISITSGFLMGILYIYGKRKKYIRTPEHMKVIFNTCGQPKGIIADEEKAREAAMKEA
jgi:hypothetical protein